MELEGIYLTEYDSNLSKICCCSDLWCVRLRETNWHWKQKSLTDIQNRSSFSGQVYILNNIFYFSFLISDICWVRKEKLFVVLMKIDIFCLSVLIHLCLSSKSLTWKQTVVSLLKFVFLNNRPPRWSIYFSLLKLSLEEDLILPFREISFVIHLWSFITRLIMHLKFIHKYINTENCWETELLE